MSDEVMAVAEKIADGGGLDDGDLLRLTASRDLIALGMAADAVRRRRHGDCATFVQVVEVPSGAGPGPGPIPADAREIRLTGPCDSVAAATAAVRAAVAAGGAIPVTGYSMTNLFELSGRDLVQLGVTLTALREAGLALVTEVAADGVLPPEQAFAVLRETGLTAARLTLGQATGEAAVALTRRVASWTGAGSVCRTLAPLPLAPSSPPTTGYGDLRQVALARLLVDNIESIQVSWAIHGPKLAQVALTFGADDVDAVPAEGTATQGWRRSPGVEIRRNITVAGLTPVPRNGCFQAINS